MFFYGLIAVVAQFRYNMGSYQRVAVVVGVKSVAKQPLLDLSVGAEKLHSGIDVLAPLVGSKTFERSIDLFHKRLSAAPGQQSAEYDPCLRLPPAYGFDELSDAIDDLGRSIITTMLSASVPSSSP